MTIESLPPMTSDQIREKSKKDYGHAFSSIFEAQYKHTQLLQTLSQNNDDVKAEEKAQNAVRYQERAKQELEALKVDYKTQNQILFQESEPVLKSKAATRTQEPFLSNRLPIELNYEIVEKIIASEPSQERQQTLKRLCETSNEFRQIAEPHLYEDVGDLNTLQKQWRFRYAIAIHPELAKRVKKVHLLWQSGGANASLLLELCLACCNMEELLIQRADNKDDCDTFDHQDGIQLCKILQSTKNLKSFTWACFIPNHKMIQTENDGDASPPQLEATQAKEIFPSLVHLDLRGWTNYFSAAMFANLTDKLKSISLGFQCEVDEEVLHAISTNCTSLRKISLLYHGGIEAVDLIQFARQTPQLENLQITKVNQDQHPDWFANVICQELWKSLRGLHFGMGWTVNRSTFAALALPIAPNLETLYIWDIEDDVAENEEELIVQMLNRQADTLQECRLGGPDYFTAGKTTLSALQNAKQLRTISIPSLHESVEAKDIDVLLTKCPHLYHLSAAMKNVSEKKEEWEARELSHLNQTNNDEWVYTRLGT